MTIHLQCCILCCEEIYYCRCTMIPMQLCTEDVAITLHPKCLWLKTNCYSKHSPMPHNHNLRFHLVWSCLFFFLFFLPNTLLGIWLCTSVIVYAFYHRVNSLEKYRNSTPIVWNQSPYCKIILCYHGSTCWSLVALAITTFASSPPFFSNCS